MPALRRWIRIWVLTGLCVGLFACLGGVAEVGAIEASATSANGVAPVAGAPTEIRRSTVVDTAPEGDECECCASRCSMTFDRARSSVDVTELWTLWTLLGLTAALAFAYTVMRRQLSTAHDRSRWWCRPTSASLCVIIR